MFNVHGGQGHGTAGAKDAWCYFQVQGSSGYKRWYEDNPAHYGLWGGRELVGVWLLVVIVTLLGEHLADVWLVGLSGLSSAKGANGLFLHVTC